MMSGYPLCLQLFEGVREWIVSDVVKQGCERDERALGFIDFAQPADLGEHAECAPREMIHADSMIEARMCSARIDEVRVSELLDVPESLKRCRVHNPHGDGIEAYRIPQRVAYRQSGHLSAFDWEQVIPASQ
jgi:hypothetical protein